jgi:hypothetical protein
LTNETALAYLVDRCEWAITPDLDEQQMMTRYERFMGLNERLYQHTYRLAESIGGATSLLWFITQTVRHVVHAYLRLWHRMSDRLDYDQDRFQRHLTSHLSFSWVVFRNARVITFQRADDVCELLASVGMLSYGAGFRRVAEVAVSNAQSVADSFCRLVSNPDPWQVADLLSSMRYLRILAAARGDDELVALINEKMGRPQTLPEDSWPFVQEALENRREHIERDLARGRSSASLNPDEPIAVLRSALAQGE